MNRVCYIKTNQVDILYTLDMYLLTEVHLNQQKENTFMQTKL